MADYQFLTTWCIDAPIEAVFDVLNDSPGYPRWWKGVVSVEVLEEGDEIGVGELDHFTWRSLLPYSLGFDLRVSRVKRPYLIEGYASGELEGLGTWRLYEGDGVAVIYDWRVRTTKRWMNVATPLGSLGDLGWISFGRRPRGAGVVFVDAYRLVWLSSRR